MGCLLAVTQGSAQPPRFIVLEYQGAKKEQAPVVLVGKGVTFDTGGISLKDPPGMDEMKFDMSGAAAVIAALTLAAQLRLQLNVVGLVAAVENMPGGKAVKPGDIVTSAAGQTVEILNTDAEGRLILCDALHYARRFRPGRGGRHRHPHRRMRRGARPHHAGVMGNDDKLAQELVAAGVRADDRCWQLPLTEDYAESAQEQLRRLRQRRRPRRRRDHRRRLPREIHPGTELGAPGRRGHRLPERRAEGQHGPADAAARGLPDPARRALTRHGQSHARAFRHVRFCRPRRPQRLHARLLRVR